MEINENHPLVKEVLKVEDLFIQIRSKYCHERNWKKAVKLLQPYVNRNKKVCYWGVQRTGIKNTKILSYHQTEEEAKRAIRKDDCKKYLPFSKPWEGRYFKIFAKFVVLLERIPQIDPEKFIEAQFEMQRKRETYPNDLISEFAINRYFKYIQLRDEYEKTKPLNINLVKEKDKNNLNLYCYNHDIKDAWSVMVTYRGLDIPLPISMWLDSSITSFYIIDTNPEDVIHWAKILHEKGIISDDKFKVTYTIYTKFKTYDGEGDISDADDKGQHFFRNREPSTDSTNSSDT